MPERSTLRAFARDALDVAREALGVGGIVAITYGGWLIYKPAGFIIAGAFALAICVLLSRRAA